jgi:imidazolonepropionase-like amidohydrolase
MINATLFVTLAHACQGAVESGSYQLHKYAQPVGRETYQLASDIDARVLTADFKFTDRGTPVALTATMRLTFDLTCRSFEIKGKTSRPVPIDSSVTVNGANVAIRQAGKSRAQAVPAQFFAIGAYAPVSGQMMLLRYWKSHGRPKSLPTLPQGKVSIQARGRDVVTANGRAVALERFTISGLMWGLETVWLDDKDRLVALVGCDTEADHFEAFTDEYDSQLPFFTARAAEDQMALLAELTKSAAAKTSRTTAIVGATLVDGTGRPPVNDAVVVTSGSKIVAAGPRASVKVPRGATVIQAKGKWITPGLWDMHAHYNQVEWGPIYLAAGVTTARDCANEFDYILAVRKTLAQGKGVGPQLLLAGVVDGESPMSLGTVRVNTAEDAKKVVARYKAAGFDQIKIYQSVKPEMVKAICDEAHKVGLSVTGHIPNGMDIIQGVESGMDQVNHISSVHASIVHENGKPIPFDLKSPQAQKVFQTLKSHRTVIDPTVALYELLFHSAEPPITVLEPGIGKLPPEMADLAAAYSGVASPARQKWQVEFIEIIKELHRQGIRVVAGSDQAIPGHSVHREMELYQQAGFTPMEALQSACLVPAQVMGRDKTLGTVQPGKRADLVIVDGDPTVDVRNMRKIYRVMAVGKLYNPAPLWKSVGFKP